MLGRGHRRRHEDLVDATLATDDDVWSVPDPVPDPAARRTPRVALLVGGVLAVGVVAAVVLARTTPPSEPDLSTPTVEQPARTVGERTGFVPVACDRAQGDAATVPQTPPSTRPALLDGTYRVRFNGRQLRTLGLVPVQDSTLERDVTAVVARGRLALQVQGSEDSDPIRDYWIGSDIGSATLLSYSPYRSPSSDDVLLVTGWSRTSSQVTWNVCVVGQGARGNATRVRALLLFSRPWVRVG